MKKKLKLSALSLEHLDDIYWQLKRIFAKSYMEPFAVVVRKHLWIHEYSLKDNIVTEGQEDTAAISKLKQLLRKIVQAPIVYREKKQSKIFVFMTPTNRWQMNSSGVLSDPYCGEFAQAIGTCAVRVRRQSGVSDVSDEGGILFRRPYIRHRIFAIIIVTLLTIMRHKEIKNCEMWILEKYGFNQNLVGAIRVALQSHISEYLTWRKILRSFKPKAAILVCSYDNYAFLHACKSEGVQTVEIQHGLIGDQHFAYHKAPKELFPDHFFAFGDFWLENCELPIPLTHQWAIGSPWLSAVKSECIVANSLHAIIILQPGFTDKDYQLIRKLTRTLQADGYTISIKPHPKNRTFSSEIREEFLSKIENLTILDTACNLIREIGMARVVIGKNSTALVEAVALGKVAITIEDPPYSFFKNLVEEGLVLKFASDFKTADILDAKVNFHNRLYKGDSIENFKNALLNIVS